MFVAKQIKLREYVGSWSAFLIPMLKSIPECIINSNVIIKISPLRRLRFWPIYKLSDKYLHCIKVSFLLFSLDLGVLPEFHLNTESSSF
jgi:hypothetical protein